MALGKVRALVSLIVMIYVVSPVVFKYSPFIQRSLLFMNYVNTQYKFNLSQPEQLGIKCSRLLRLDHTLVSHQGAPGESNIEKAQLGAWHILPESSLSSCVTDHQQNHTTIEDKLAFADTRPIVLYIHGNGGNRAGSHRGRLYLRLAYEHNYHIITFDYRGFGDSTYEMPSAAGLSLDASFMYHWLLEQPNVTKERIIVWGHSLGTAVAIQMVAGLSEPKQPKKLILEAPFDSVANAVANHPFSTPFRIIPYFEYFFVEPIEQSPDLNFDSLKKIGNIKSSLIMILHAEDDGIIPFKLGENLYRQARKELGESQVKFVALAANLGLGHKYICSHDETMSRVRTFVAEN